MSVISLVPSWTETLIEAGVPVVGRTRYCIHPQHQILDIPEVGGTKDINWKKVETLKPKLLLVDKEENRKEVLEKVSCPVHVSHVRSVEQMPAEILNLIEGLKQHQIDAGALPAIAKRWGLLLSQKQNLSVSDMPGVLNWINKPSTPIDKVVYIIWKKPWMTVDRETFIGSVLNHLGYGGLLPQYKETYPKIELDSFDQQKTLFLYSSEPYDFGNIDEIAEIRRSGQYAAIVDGESYSWFGLRSLKFLEST